VAVWDYNGRTAAPPAAMIAATVINKASSRRAGATIGNYQALVLMVPIPLQESDQIDRRADSRLARSVAQYIRTGSS
jgi:hypothetical protein